MNTNAITIAICVALVLMTACGNAMAGETSATVVRIAEIEVDPQSVTEYKTLLAKEIETSVRIEPGVLSLNAVALKSAPTHIRILEVYANNAAYEAHLKSPHFIEYKSSTSSMVKSLTLLETTPIMLCAKPGDTCHEK